MSKTVVDGDSKVGIELQEFLEEVNAFISTSFVDLSNVLSLDSAKGVQILLCFLVCHETEVIFSWGTKHLENDCQLVLVGEREAVSLLGRLLVWGEREAGLAGEQRLSVKVGGSVLLHHSQKLSEYASDRPHINGRPVVFLKQDKFRSSVPSGHNMPCQLSLHVLPLILCSYQSMLDVLFLLFKGLCLLFCLSLLLILMMNLRFLSIFENEVLFIRIHFGFIFHIFFLFFLP